jgi:two-component system, chemotaxis family, sensor kinase CheA
MATLAEAMWKEVVLEFDDRADAVEDLLSESGQRLDSAELVGGLLRAFHSLKGMLLTVGLRGMAGVAHQCESLLVLVRQGTCPLDGDILDLLRRSLDDLKAMRDQTACGGRDIAPPHSLVGDLDRAYEGRAGCPAPTDLFHHEDTVDHMAGYWAKVEELLPRIGRAATAEVLDDTVWNAARAALIELRAATENAGLVDIAPILARVGEVLEGGRSDEARVTVVEALAGFRSELAALEQKTAAGGLDLGDRLSVSLQAEVRAILDSMVSAMARFSNLRNDDSDQAVAEMVAVSAHSACSFFLFLDLQQASRMLLMIQDVFSRVASNEIYLDQDLLGVADQAIALLDGMRGPVVRWQDVADTEADAILERFRQTVMACVRNAGGTGVVAALKRMLADYDISDELVAVLSAENINHLLGAVRGGCRQIYEVVANLEASEEIAARFMAFLKDGVTPITNRTIFLNGQPWFGFLLVSNLTSAEMAERVSAVDASGTNISVRSCRAAAKTNMAAGGEQAAASIMLRVPTSVADRLMAGAAEITSISDARRGLTGRWNVEGAVNGLWDHLLDTGAPAEVMALLERLAGHLDESLRLDSALVGGCERLQGALQEMREVPAVALFNRFYRVVRDSARTKGSDVRLDIEGGEVTIDKEVLGLLTDPLMHMVRNAVDHGIETPEERRAAGKPATGHIRLTAERRDGRMLIEVVDDGRGLDVERIRAKAVESGMVAADVAGAMPDRDIIPLVFLAGLSTAAEVTESSGRGVGMDVARTNVERMGGTIAVETRRGVGTTFTLSMPLRTAAVVG